jgi:hypothetical protein
VSFQLRSLRRTGGASIPSWATGGRQHKGRACGPRQVPARKAVGHCRAAIIAGFGMRLRMDTRYLLSRFSSQAPQHIIGFSLAFQRQLGKWVAPDAITEKADADR